MAGSSYEIFIVPIEKRALAVIKEVAWAQNIGPKIGATMGALHEGLRQLGVTETGRDVVVYHPQGEGMWDSPPGIHVEIGVQLKEPLHVEKPPVLRSETPAGRAAHALHVGPYQLLPEAHHAIHQWCREHGHTLAGLNWEVYGPHHADDPSKLRTDVFYELK
ncbi:MAG TPA: GyrI-like domain-containing protein [Polyangiaceae bacterium]|nr:GyrI-like domain-containing protein [Polyangiaceae bacterium]